MLCFIFNGKELPFHKLTITNLFHDVFCDVYLRSLNVLHFLKGQVSIKTPIITSQAFALISQRSGLHFGKNVSQGRFWYKKAYHKLFKSC